MEKFYALSASKPNSSKLNNGLEGVNLRSIGKLFRNKKSTDKFLLEYLGNDLLRCISFDEEPYFEETLFLRLAWKKGIIACSYDCQCFYTACLAAIYQNPYILTEIDKKYYSADGVCSYRKLINKDMLFKLTLAALQHDGDMYTFTRELHDEHWWEDSMNQHHVFELIAIWQTSKVYHYLTKTSDWFLDDAIVSAVQEGAVNNFSLLEDLMLCEPDFSEYIPETAIQMDPEIFKIIPSDMITEKMRYAHTFSFDTNV